MSSNRFIFNTPHDADVSPFDPAGSGLISTEVGPALRELYNTAAVSASPGFTWGDSGNVKNAYLQNDTVPSDQSGRLCPVNGNITTVFVTTETTSVGQLEIQRRVGAVYTTLTTVTMPAGFRKAIFVLVTQPVVAIGDEFCILVNNTDTMKNPVAGLIIKGSLT